MLLVAVILLDIFNEPEKDDEPVPDRVRLPVEARVRSTVLDPFNIWSDSEAVPVLLAAWIKNFC